MDDRPRPKPDAELLPEALTKRVLTRASELDALRRAGATIADLRAAATEAGISPQAFEDALAEVRSGEGTQIATAAPRRTRVRAIVAAVALLIGLTLYAVRRTVVPASSTTVVETLSMRCLTPAQVGELLRPVVNPGTTAISFSDASPGVFTIRATAADLVKVKSLLETQQVCANPE